jgi:cystathionine beta-lyase/cystathionine gamma-synthase
MCIGITENFARISVGIEDYQDIENDLEQAFTALANSQIEEIKIRE